MADENTLWNWIKEEVKKLPNYPNTTDNQYSDWQDTMLDKADDNAEWYVANNFNELMPQAVRALLVALFH